MRCSRRGGNWIPAVVVSIGLSFGSLHFSNAAELSAIPGADAKSGVVDPRVTAFLRDAATALKTGDVNLAIIQLKNAVQLAPHQAEPRARLGLALLQQAGSAVAAERELRQARKDGAADSLVVPGILTAMLMRGETQELLAEFAAPPDNAPVSPAADILRARAIALENLGRTAEAVAAVQRALMLRRDAPTLLVRVDIARRQNDFGLARQLVDESIRLDPLNRDARVASVTMYRQSADFQKELAAAEDYFRRDPQNITATILKVQALLDLKRDPEAKLLITALLKRRPDSLVANFYRAVLTARTGDFKTAWGQLLNLPPEYVVAQPSTAMVAAQIAAASGNLEPAGAILNRFVSKNPDFAPARLQLAEIRVSQADPQSALSVLDRIKSDSNPQTQAVLAQIYLELHQYRNAIEALEKATAGSRLNADSLLRRQLALSELEIGDTDRALQDLRELAGRDPGNGETAWQLTRILLQTGRTDEAFAVIDRMAKAQPVSPLPSFYRAIVFAAQGDLAQASAALDKSTAIDPKFIPALFYRADVARARGQPEQAVRELQQIIARDPAFALAYVKLADIAADDGRDPDAVALLTRAITAAPNDVMPRLALANYEFGHRQYREALETTSALLKLAPRNTEALALEGQIQIASGAHKDGIATLRSVAAANPQSAAAQVLLANGLFMTRDVPGAENAAAKAVELEPSFVQVRSLLIQLQIANGKPDAAMTTARAYASEHPGSTADTLLADTMLRLKRGSEAYALLEKSFAKNADPTILLRLGQLSVAQGDSKRAIALLTGWLDKHPADFDVRLQYATILLQLGDRDAARREFETLLKQRPENPVVLNNLGWLIQDQNPARARALVGIAAKIAPRQPDILDTFAWMKFHDRDIEGSLRLLRRAHDLDTGNPEIGYHLAVALDASGKRAEAKELLKSVLAKNAHFEDAKNAEQLMARE